MLMSFCVSRLFGNSNSFALLLQFKKRVTASLTTPHLERPPKVTERHPENLFKNILNILIFFISRFQKNK